jgi:vacuolar-type H+-ATPase subunit E/Vma4
VSVTLLLEDLRRKSAERVAAAWQRVEGEAAALRAQEEADLAAARVVQERQQQEAEQAATEPVLRAAAIEALRCEDDALRELGGRLQEMARERLASLRDEGYPALFAGLAAELPQIGWGEVRVHPDDIELARRHFPGAEIQGEEAVGGGFIVSAATGGLRVVCTLARRLELAWPLALPRLLREAEKEHAALAR